MKTPALNSVYNGIDTLARNTKLLAEAVLLAAKRNPAWVTEYVADPAAQVVRACLSDTPPNGQKAALHGCEVYGVSRLAGWETCIQTGDSSVGWFAWFNLDVAPQGRVAVRDQPDGEALATAVAAMLDDLGQYAVLAKMEMTCRHDDGNDPYPWVEDRG